MIATALQLLHFEGGDALPAFRAQALLARLQAACPRITTVAARFVHWVGFDSPPARAELDKLQGLLSYGEAYAGPAAGELVVVMPRLGTVSPWASKACARKDERAFPPSKCIRWRADRLMEVPWRRAGQK